MRQTRRWCAFAALPCLSALLCGCASGPAHSTTPATPASSSNTNNTVTVTAPGGKPAESQDRTPLLINGEPVPWATLRPRLAEVGGGLVVDELALEHALGRELSIRGKVVSDDDVRAERERWTELVGTESLAAQTETTIRARRGLGPVRFDRLLWRNAALRALLDPSETEVSDAEIRLAREIRSGTRFAVTGVVAPDSRTALRIARSAGQDSRGAIAGLWSASAAEELRPWHGIVSPADPAYPQALRRVLPGTSQGSASGVVALDDGFGLVVVHAEIPPGPAPSDSELRDELKIRKTRVAMERLAERLIERTRVHAMDRSLSATR